MAPHRARARSVLVVSTVIALAAWLAFAPDARAVTPHTIDHACPPGEIPEDGFTDVPPDNVHETAIDCVVWWKIVNGTAPGQYSPANAVTRAQLASYVARLLEAWGYDLDDNPPDWFDDDNGNAHELRINQIVSMSIVQGTGPRQYSPDVPVSRAQMATFLARAYFYIAGEELSTTNDYFTDDNGNTHEANINNAASVGIVAGVTATEYHPNDPVRRDAMGSFAARMLDIAVEQRAAFCPGEDRTQEPRGDCSSTTTSTT